MIKKYISMGLIAAIIISVSSTLSFASGMPEGYRVSSAETKPEALSSQNEGTATFQFGSFDGTVKKASDQDNGSKNVLLESSDQKEANFVITNETYVVNGDNLTEGAYVTGYFDATAPILMIYPPRYNAEAVVVQSKDQIVKVDVFDKDLTSSDGFLKLNISDKTEVISKNGTTYKGDLSNRKLLVVYTTSTKSIPSQTNPLKVVVLSDKEVAPAESTPDNAASLDILVNGKKLDCPSAYTNKNGVVMVPLRAVAEAAGFDVKWDGKLKSITLGKGISLTLDNDYYVYMKTAPIQLGTSPALINDKTFVPLNFFTEVAKLQSAQVSDTHIEITN